MHEKHAKLIDWRIGYHIEAAAKIIGGAMDRIASAMERANMLEEKKIMIQEEHAQYARLDRRDMAMQIHEAIRCRCKETDGKGCPIPAHQSAVDTSN